MARENNRIKFAFSRLCVPVINRLCTGAAKIEYSMCQNTTMRKHLKLVLCVAAIHFSVFVFWFFLAAFHGGATEHARMFDRYVPTFYHRVLEVVGYLIMAPLHLTKFILPNFELGMWWESLWNVYLSGSIAFVISYWNTQRKRTPSVSDG